MQEDLSVQKKNFHLKVKVNLFQTFFSAEKHTGN